MESLTGALTSFFEKCPLIDGELHMDFSPEGSFGFAVKTEDTVPVVQWYLDGSSERRLDFTLLFNGFYSGDPIQNTGNRILQEQLTEWIEENGLPELPSPLAPLALDILQTGMSGADALHTSARYSIKCRLLYMR